MTPIPCYLAPFNVAGAALLAASGYVLTFFIPAIVSDVRLLIDLHRTPPEKVVKNRGDWRDHHGK